MKKIYIVTLTIFSSVFSHGQSSLGLAWSEMGPDNAGGRCRAVLPDKMNSNRIFAGAASGGLLRSDNFGASWYAVNDQSANQNISCLWQDNDGNIYIGTGEGFAFGGKGDGTTGFIGGGLLKMTYNSSVDSYSAPTLISSTAPAPNNNALSTNWLYINCVKTSPVKTGSNYRIYAATNTGFYYSDDDGATWINPTGVVAWCSDIEVTDSVIYFSLGHPDSSGGTIHRTDTSLTFFNNITPASVNAMYAGRIELAAHEDSAHIIYTSVARPANVADPYTFQGVFQSKDFGNTWYTIAVSTTAFQPFATPGTGNSSHSLVVYPGDPNKILLGGNDVYRWTQINSGSTGTGQWDQVTDNFQASPLYVHCGINAISFKGEHDTILIASNGGVYSTTNNCNSFSAMNQTLNISQFTSVAFERDALTAGAYNGAGVIGGMYGKGAQYISGNGTTVYSSIQVSGGEYGNTEASMISPNTFFYAAEYGLLFRSMNKSFGTPFYPKRNMISCSDNSVPGDSSFASRFSAFALYENPSSSTSKLVCGFNGSVFLCTNPLDTTTTPNWIKIAGNNSVEEDGNTPSQFFGKIRSINYTDDDVIYAGTEDGRLYRIKGISLITDSANHDLDSTANCLRRISCPARCRQIGAFGKPITSLSVDPTDADRLVVTLGGYNYLQHVYYSDSASFCTGSTGTSNFSSLPAVNNPVYSSCFILTATSQANPSSVLIGTEDGVYSIDLNDTLGGWTPEKGTMFPSVPVVMIKQQRLANWECYNSGVIYAATHGRGIWKSETFYSPLSPGWKEISNSDLQIEVSPNPANENLNLHFTLNDLQDVSISFYNATGKQVRYIDIGKTPAGEHKIPISTGELAAGLYLVRLQQGILPGKTVKVVIQK